MEEVSLQEMLTARALLPANEIAAAVQKMSDQFYIKYTRTG